jgi:hypothetical protein
MNESLLSQQLREALAEIEYDGEFVELYHPETSRVSRVLYRRDINYGGLLNAVHELGKVAEVLNLIPQLLTEHEALQRKADAGEVFAEAIERTGCGDEESCCSYCKALSAYREATKPSDV